MWCFITCMCSSATGMCFKSVVRKITEGKCRVIVCNMSSMSVPINLVSTPNVLLIVGRQTARCNLTFILLKVRHLNDLSCRNKDHLSSLTAHWPCGLHWLLVQNPKTSFWFEAELTINPLPQKDSTFPAKCRAVEFMFGNTANSDFLKKTSVSLSC